MYEPYSVLFIYTNGLASLLFIQSPTVLFVCLFFRVKKKTDMLYLPCPLLVKLIIIYKIPLMVLHHDSVLCIS